MRKTISKDTPEGRAETLMRSLQLTRQQFAEDLGLSLSSIAMYFTGHHKIRRIVALAMQARYGVSATWIMEGKGHRMLPDSRYDLSDDALIFARRFERAHQKRKLALNWLTDPEFNTQPERGARKMK